MPAIRGHYALLKVKRPSVKSPKGYSTDDGFAIIFWPALHDRSWPDFLALTLFVFWFNTDNAYNATTLDDLAVTADLLHGSTNFHFTTPLSQISGQSDQDSLCSPSWLFSLQTHIDGTSYGSEPEP